MGVGKVTSSRCQVTGLEPGDRRGRPSWNLIPDTCYLACACASRATRLRPLGYGVALIALRPAYVHFGVAAGSGLPSRSSEGAKAGGRAIRSPERACGEPVEPVEGLVLGRWAFKAARLRPLGYGVAFIALR